MPDIPVSGGIASGRSAGGREAWGREEDGLQVVGGTGGKATADQGEGRGAAKGNFRF